MLRPIDDGAYQKVNPSSLVDLGFQSPQTEEELALARFLQNLEPTDPRVSELLIDHYAPEIHRLVHALLDCLNENEEHPLPSEINTVVQQVFVKAALDFDQFEREASARVWLSKIAVNLVQTHRRKQKRSRRPTYTGPAPRRETDHPPTEIEQHYRAAVTGLTERQRIVVVLRYVHNLAIPHIDHRPMRHPAKHLGFQRTA
jgi:DNA-directed RNA polymerase specialized sigma24 family protein